MARKAGYLWVISCSNRDLLYKDLIEEFLSDESIAYCVDSGFIKPVDETTKEHITMWTMNPNNEIFFDDNLFKEKFLF